MCLAQANADLAEAAEKLGVIRKKLAVRLLCLKLCTDPSRFAVEQIKTVEVDLKLHFYLDDFFFMLYFI